MIWGGIDLTKYKIKKYLNTTTVNGKGFFIGAYFSSDDLYNKSITLTIDGVLLENYKIPSNVDGEYCSIGLFTYNVESKPYVNTGFDVTSSNSYPIPFPFRFDKNVVFSKTMDYITVLEYE